MADRCEGGGIGCGTIILLVVVFWLGISVIDGSFTKTSERIDKLEAKVDAIHKVLMGAKP